jgi:hypothetical protein
MFLRTATTSFLFITGCLVVACSSAPVDGPSSGNSAVSKGPNNTTTPPPAPTDKSQTQTPAPSKSVGTAAVCGAKTTYDDCSKCCLGDNLDNGKVGDLAWDKCGCDWAKSKCSDACVQSLGLCNPDPSGAASGTASSGDGPDPCDSCNAEMDAALNACKQTADAACNADPTCAAASKCMADSKCDDKADAPSSGGDTEGSSGGTSGSGQPDPGGN